jgi:hypothetical protein
LRHKVTAQLEAEALSVGDACSCRWIWLSEVLARLAYLGRCAGYVGHPFKKSLFDNDDNAFQALFLRTDVLSSQHRC